MERGLSTGKGCLVEQSCDQVLAMESLGSAALAELTIYLNPIGHS